MNTNKLKCSRCGSDNPPFYDHSEMDEDTQEVTVSKICWDCDWELMNGRGEYSDDVGEILEERAVNAYEYDPINNPPPTMRGTSP